MSSSVKHRTAAQRASHATADVASAERAASATNPVSAMPDERATLLPYGLTPAPLTSLPPPEPVDLGEYEPTYAGWKVIFRRNVPLSVYAELRDMMRTSQRAGNDAEKLEVLEPMRDFIAQIALAWNFVDDFGMLIRQPTEGGADDLGMDLVPLVAQAFNKRMQPPKIGGRR